MGGMGLAFCVPMMSTWFFGCRHTFEETLVSEISARSPPGAASCGLVAPGLLRVDGEVLGRDAQPRDWDLTYALQVLPDAHLIGFDQASISDLAKEAVGAVGLDAGGKRFDDLRKGPKGALAVHALVPDQVAKYLYYTPSTLSTDWGCSMQFRGTPVAKAKMYRRCSTIVDKISKTLRTAV
jgi:hypothetical protein